MLPPAPTPTSGGVQRIVGYIRVLHCTALWGLLQCGSSAGSCRLSVSIRSSRMPQAALHDARHCFSALATRSCDPRHRAQSGNTRTLSRGEIKVEKESASRCYAVEHYDAQVGGDDSDSIAHNGVDRMCNIRLKAFAGE